MANDTIRQSVLFDELADKVVVARFDQPQASSDGGAVLLAVSVRNNSDWRAIRVSGGGSALAVAIV